METEKFEAIGERGEACLIHMKRVALPSGESDASYSLATGERLRMTGQEGEFETLDGKRKFRLRFLQQRGLEP